MAENGVELAKAYVQIVPSMQGMQGALEAELNGTGDIGRQAGGKLGEGLTSAFEKAIEFIGDSVQTGMGFDSAMSQVAATMGKTTDEIAELRDYAKEMGAETAFSATQSAEALNFMALAGYDANTSIKMLPNVMNLAAAGGMELARASDMITDSQTALGLSLSETETLVDQMAKTSSTTNTSVSQLGDAMLTIGGTAKTLSGGTDELNQVLGIMADNGIKAGEAGTHLRNIILAMQPTTKDAIAAFDELGFSAYDSQGDLREMSDIFGELSEKTADMTSQERQDIIGKIFNKTDLSTVNALLDTSAERWDEVAEAIDGADGAAKAMADTQLDNLQGDITLMKSAFEGLQIAISDEVTPDLRELVQTATKGLEWAAEHIHTIIGAVEALGIAVAAVKLPAFIGLLGAAKTSMVALGNAAAAHPIIAAFAAAVAVGLELKGVIDDATDAINEIPDAYEGLDEEEIGFVKSLAEQTDDLTEATNRRKEAEDRLHAAKNERFVLESNLRLAEEEYSRLMEEGTGNSENFARAAELANGVIPQLRDKISEQNAAVGELSAAFLSASDNVRTLTEEQEAEQTAAEEAAAAQEKEAEAEAQAASAAEELAAAYDTYRNAMREALKEAVTVSIELEGQTAELSRVTAEKMGNIIDAYNTMYETQRSALEGSVDLFGGFTASTETTFDELWKNLNDTNYYLNDWADAIEQLEDRGLGEGVVQSLKDMGTDSWEIVYALNHATDEQLAEYTSKWEETQSDMAGIARRMTSNAKSAAEEQLQELSGIPEAKLEQFQSAFEKLGIKSGESIAKGIGEQFDKIESAIDSLDDAAIDGLSAEDFPGMETVGEYFAQGIEHGLLGGEDSIRSAADTLAAAAVDQIKKDLKISSPSKIGEELGGFFPLGVAEGIEKDAPRAAKAASDMARKIVEAAEITAPRNLTAIADGSTAALRRATASTLDGKPEGGEKQSARGVTITFNQTNNSPKALSRWDTYRQTKTLLRELKGAF